jgi:hypothetical protein
MKKIFVLRFFLVTAIFLGIFSIQAQVNNDTTVPAVQNRIVQVEFDDYFFPNTLRVDYYIAGDYKTESVYLNQVMQEPYWSGPRKHLIDPFNYGNIAFYQRIL